MLKYTTFAKENSMFNTPSCFTVYTINLVLKLLEETIGGLKAMEKINQEKGALLYNYIDQSGYYRGTAEKDSRSLMNVTFRLPSEELEAKFVAEALKNDLAGLERYRFVGGCRAPSTTPPPKQAYRPWWTSWRPLPRPTGKNELKRKPPAPFGTGGSFSHADCWPVYCAGDTGKKAACWITRGMS